MSSQIDETLPIFGETPGPTTASVRANFATAKAEITALQDRTAAAPFLALAGGTMTGPFYLYNDPTDVMMPATKGYVDAHAGSGDGGGGIPEAPADTNFYGRHDGSWQPVLPMTGGILTGILTLSGPPVGGLDAATKAYVDAAGNQTITITGDATGSGAASIPLTLATVFSTPGTFQGLTIDGKGRITAAANQNYAPLANPAFTGTPTGPTAPAATNSTQLATTAYVKNQSYTTGGPYLPIVGGAISGALSVAGAFTLGGNFYSSAGGGVFTISGTPTITGQVTVGGLSTAGGVTCAGLTVNGTTSLIGDMGCSGSASIANSMTVGGGGLNCSAGNLTVGPQINFGGAGGVCTIGGNGTFSGTTTFLGNTISYQAHVPGADNSGSVGTPGVNWNQMNCYNYFQPSDRRAKTAIADLPPCLDLVRLIAPKSYRLAEGDDRAYWGFIAQDVGEAMAAAGYDFGGHVVGEGGREALSYNDLVAVLWQALRELIQGGTP